MKKLLQQFLFGSLCAAILVAGSAANAQTTTTKAKVADAKVADTPREVAKTERKWYPFYGTVASVDTKAKTVSLKKIEGVRLLQTDSKTTLEMNGKSASLADIKPGYYLHGKLHKDSDKDEAILDAKIEKEAPERKHPGTMNELHKKSTPADMASEDEAAAPKAPAPKKKTVKP
jgi:hypothetical protein